MGVELLQRAVAASAPVVDAVAPAQYELPTPCASWTVTDLLDHVIGAQQRFVEALGVDVEPPSDDPATRFHAVAAAALAAFGADGVMERTVELPFGAMPGSFVVNLAAADMFVHAWDLARATGQSTDLDPELADDLYGVVSQMLQPQWRGPDGQAAFGEEQQPPAGATAADRLAAFTGRIV